MDAKLAAYRSKKRREAMIEGAKNSLRGALSWTERTVDVTPTESTQLRLCGSTFITFGFLKKLCFVIGYFSNDMDDVESIASEESIDITPPENPVLRQVTHLLHFLLWATLYIIALQFEFGAVYFIITALIFIWRNTRSGPKKKGEISAYSVFNPNCEAIDGSINPEQFERELGYRALSHFPG